MSISKLVTSVQLIQMLNSVINIFFSVRTAPKRSISSKKRLRESRYVIAPNTRLIRNNLEFIIGREFQAS